MAKAKKSEPESTQKAADKAGDQKPAAKKPPAKKTQAQTDAGAGTAPLAAIPAPSAQPAKPAAAGGKKAAAKKGGKSETAKPAGPTGSPLVDTSLAAESAARMLAGRAKLGNQQQPQAQKESGLFKQLKQNVNKPALGAGGSTLANTFAPARGGNLPVAGGKQVAHNQTQGGVNKINVPRRTGG